MKKNHKYNDYYDDDAYSFIRSISTPQDENEKKSGKKRYGVIFLIIFSLVFIAAAKYTYDEKSDAGEVSTDREIHYKPVISTGDSPAQNLLSDEEINQKLNLYSQSDNRYTLILENKSKYPSDLLQAVCRNPEIVDFAVGYLTTDGSVNGEITENDLSSNVPLFIQWDTRWGYVPYGDNVIGLSGCGPTCLSMVAVAMTGNLKYSPDYIANFAARHGYYEESTGTSWALFNEGCKEFDLISKELPLNYNSMTEVLDEEKPIICSLNPGDFTAVGHFIVIKGTDENGDFIINDPNSRTRSAKVWSYEELEWQIRNMWYFYT